MMKNGEMPVPIERVPALANALGIDPLWLLERVLAEQDPELRQTFEDLFGLLLTEHERDFIRRLRVQANGGDVRYRDEAVNAAIAISK
jgi:hypothetical protein